MSKRCVGCARAIPVGARNCFFCGARQPSPTAPAGSSEAATVVAVHGPHGGPKAVTVSASSQSRLTLHEAPESGLDLLGDSLRPRFWKRKGEAPPINRKTTSTTPPAVSIEAALTHIAETVADAHSTGPALPSAADDAHAADGPAPHADINMPEATAPAAEHAELSAMPSEPPERSLFTPRREAFSAAPDPAQPEIRAARPAMAVTPSDPPGRVGAGPTGSPPAVTTLPLTSMDPAPIQAPLPPPATSPHTATQSVPDSTRVAAPAVAPAASVAGPQSPPRASHPARQPAPPSPPDPGEPAQEPALAQTMRLAMGMSGILLLLLFVKINKLFYLFQENILFLHHLCLVGGTVLVAAALLRLPQRVRAFMGLTIGAAVLGFGMSALVRNGIATGLVIVLGSVALPSGCILRARPRLPSNSRLILILGGLLMMLLYLLPVSGRPWLVLLGVLARGGAGHRLMALLLLMPLIAVVAAALPQVRQWLYRGVFWGTLLIVLAPMIVFALGLIHESPNLRHLGVCLWAANFLVTVALAEVVGARFGDVP